MFKAKSIAEYTALSDAEKEIYATEKAANDKAEFTKQIEDATKSLKEDNTKLADIVKEQGSQMAKLKENGNSSIVKTYKEQVSEFIDKNFDEILSIHKAKSGVIQLKVAGDITTGSGVNTAPPSITGVQQAPLSNINLRGFNVSALTTNFNTNESAFPYTESVPKDGDYAFLAEGEIKPQIDFTWETEYAKPVKTAAWVRLTDESIKDVANLQSVANDFLRKKHDLKKAKGILFGDGISPNPKGATTYGRTFVAGAMALAVVNPNFMDVVNASVTDVATTHNYEDEMPYMANLVMINPIDFFIQLVSAKDDNGLPLFPTASLNNQVVIGGITIMPEETIPSGKVFVADMSKYNTTNYVGYNVQIGWVNDDFIKNQFVILAESRFHAFVKKLDEQAFIYDDIATIKAAITAV